MHKLLFILFALIATPLHAAEDWSKRAAQRDVVLKDGVLHVQAGAGIVADSDPAYEQRECEAKAGALIAAAREAVRVAGEAGFGQ